jgi:hypothetical protein
MAKEIPRAGDLRRKSELTDNKIEAATVALTGYAWRTARTAAAA